uniref:ATP synthase F0 subunit 8 n=1 Tax=Allacma fusca TaxID=39272 RepID=A0A7D5BJC7_9HEXA|nr:ATP synthase F0 subunit 8 [Allacma fusca]
MPQMAPMMWNMIFTMSSMVSFIILTKVYFTMFNKKNLTNNKNLINKNFNKTWLW